jgi:hypothetical protein
MERKLTIEIVRVEGVDTLHFEQTGLTNIEIIGLLTLFKDEKMIEILSTATPLKKKDA